MIVISDSSPLNYLILIRQAGLLQKHYAEVLIAPAVHGGAEAASQDRQSGGPLGDPEPVDGVGWDRFQA